MSYSAVLFDAGNTLWRWNYAPALRHLRRYPHDTALVLLQALREAGAEVDDGTVRRCFAELQQTYASRFQVFETNGHGVTDAEVEAYFAQHNADFLRLLGLPDPDGRLLAAINQTFSQWRPSLFPEVASVLETLRSRGLALAIVSNGWQQEADAKRLGIAHLFDAIVGSVYVGCRKPQPEIFGLALTALGVPPEQAVHIGDSYEDDVIGARAAGIAPILVDREGTSAHGDVRTIRSLNELPEMVL